MRTMKTLALVLALICFGSAAMGGAGGSQTFSFDISEQPLSEALRALGQQAGLQIVVYSQVSGGRVAPKVTGELTVEGALERLLAHTGLRYEYLNPRTVAILPEEGEKIGDAALRTSGLRVAQADAGSSSASPDIESRSTAGTPDSANAAGSADDTKLEEIVVTAQRRKEALQDVPISITVLGGDDLDRSNAEGALESIARVPGVNLTPSQGIGNQVSIRGVAAGGTQVSGASPTAYYLDSVPFAFARNAIVPDVSAYDLDRIEVLRGPQGTLYGANALNGVVRILTHDADLDEFDLKARTSFSSTAGGGDNYRGDLAVNIPIIPGVLAARGVIGYQDQSGWVETLNERDANNARIGNTRLRVAFQPTQDLSIGLSAWYQTTERSHPDAARDDGVLPVTLPEPIDVELNVYDLSIDYDFGSATLSSSTSYLDQKLDTRYSREVFGPALTSTNTNHPVTVFTQEVYLTSDDAGDWRWSLGAMYREEEEHLFQTRVNTSGALVSPYVAPTDYITRSESSAVFGEVTRLFFDGELELTAGLRYFQDHESADEISRLTGDPAIATPGTAAATPYVHPRSEFEATTPRLVLTWLPSDDATLYASYSEGFRSGVDQLNSVLVAAPIFGPVEADTLRNYEVGAKGSLLNGTFSYEAAIYYIDWTDVQLSLPVTIGGLQQVGIINAGDAGGVGFDLALSASPVDGLEVGVTLSQNDLTLSEDVRIAGGFLYARSGERLPNSPELTFGVFADYAFPLTRALTGRFSASGNFQSEQEQRVTSTTADATRIEGDPMFLGRASFAVDGAEHWKAMLFVENLTNENRAAVAVGTSTFWTPRVRPRTVGVQLEYRY